MEVDYITLAVPAFFVLIALELGISRARHRALYRFSDTVNNLSCGIIQQVIGLLCAGFIIGGYLAIEAGFGLVSLDATSIWTWTGCFLAIDFMYYWFHRLSHEINFMWAAHVVHHQSEDYNLGVALRQSSLQQFLSIPFYWPLALIGFPPLVFVACASLNTLYQFWIHTRLIDRLGFLERILMTPSHHRVHHGRNPIYIDRNHGATFIVWDKLFGTYQEETEEVAYGITTSLESWNPIWANLQYWAEMWKTARATNAWGDKLRVFVMPPGWFPADQGGPKPAPALDGIPEKFDSDYSSGVAGWTGLQFVQVGGLAAALLFEADSQTAPAIAWVGGTVVWGLTNLGGLLERHVWACRSELVRILAMPVACLPLLPMGAKPSSVGALGLLLVANLIAARFLGVRWGGLEPTRTRASAA